MCNLVFYILYYLFYLIPCSCNACYSCFILCLCGLKGCLSSWVGNYRMSPFQDFLFHSVMLLSSKFPLLFPLFSLDIINLVGIVLVRQSVTSRWRLCIEMNTTKIIQNKLLFYYHLKAFLLSSHQLSQTHRLIEDISSGRDSVSVV